MLNIKKDLLKNLREIKKECNKNKQYCWIDFEDLLEALRLNLVTIIKKNINQKDETFKTIVEFEKRLFIYVGEKI